MRAATIRDGSIAVEEHPDPVPGDSDLLVRVRGAGLNGADILQLKGRYPAPPGAPAGHPRASSWPARSSSAAPASSASSPATA